MEREIFALEPYLAAPALALLLPLLVYLPLQNLNTKRQRLSGEFILGVSIFSTLTAILAVLSPYLGLQTALSLIGLLFLAALLGLTEDHFRLGTQKTVPCRIALVSLCYALGFGFDLSEKYQIQSPLLGFLADYPPTVIFYLGLITTFDLFDRLKGLASGVGMILSLALLSLTLRWAADFSPLILLAAGGLCAGLLLIQGRERKFLGRSGQMQIAVLLGAATIISRSWGFTLTMVLVPLLAIILPMIDRFYLAFQSLSVGRHSEKPDNLRSLLLETGLGDRWIVFFIWLVTLQFAVLVKIIYETKSIAYVIAGGLTTPLFVGFFLLFLLRIGEKLNRSRKPEALRILFLSHYFSPEVNAPASRLADHAKRWAASGHEVTVLCPVPNAPHGRIYNGYQNNLWQEEIVDGVRVIRVWTFIAANRGKLRRCLNYLSFLFSALIALLLIRRHDYLVATTPQFFCGMAGALGSFFRREKFILEIRDLWPESIVAVGAGKKGILLQCIERLAIWMYHRADHIITVGEGYRSRLINQHNLPEDRVSVTPNGVDFEIYFPTPVNQRQRLNQYGVTDEFVLAYIGTIGMAHRLNTVLEAAKLTKHRSDIRFLIVGDGAEYSDLSRKARDSQIDNVIFTGLIQKEKIPAIMNECDAFLVHLRRCPLFQSVLPSKLFEAMAMAKPVVLGVEGEALAVLRDANAGIAIEPENGAEMAEAALQLADNPQLARTYGDNGLRYVQKHYNRDRFAELYIEILSNMKEAPALSPEPAPLNSENAAVGEKPT